MRVAAILGTRPEVIKLAPVVFELRRNPDTECIVIATGQHREMLDQMLEQFELEADVDLGVMRPDQRLSDLTAELIRVWATPWRIFAPTGCSSRATRRRPSAAPWPRSTSLFPWGTSRLVSAAETSGLPSRRRRTVGS